MTTKEILTAAKVCAPAVAAADTQQKNNALLAMADALQARAQEILAANALDVEAAKGHISTVMLDRLSLNAARIDGMADGIRQVAELPDPVGRVRSSAQRPNGMVIEKVGFSGAARRLSALLMPL